VRRHSKYVASVRAPAIAIRFVPFEIWQSTSEAKEYLYNIALRAGLDSDQLVAVGAHFLGMNGAKFHLSTVSRRGIYIC